MKRKTVRLRVTDALEREAVLSLARRHGLPVLTLGREPRLRSGDAAALRRWGKLTF